MSSNPFPNNPFFSVAPFADDPFDSVLNKVVSIWKKGVSGTDVYGQPIQSYSRVDATLIADSSLVSFVPCFAEKLTGKELNVPPATTSETSFGVSTWRFYMRPIQVDSPPIDLGIHHSLQLKNAAGDADLDPNDPTSGALMYNVTDVDNPGLLNHHFEIEATLIEP
jgi:hypothetical protein